MGALFSSFFAEHTPTSLTSLSNFCCLEAIPTYSFLVARVSVFWWLKSSASCPLPFISDIAICVLVREPRTSTRAQGRTRFRTVCVGGYGDWWCWHRVWEGPMKRPVWTLIVFIGPNSAPGISNCFTTIRWKLSYSYWFSCSVLQKLFVCSQSAQTEYKMQKIRTRKNIPKDEYIS